MHASEDPTDGDPVVTLESSGYRPSEEEEPRFGRTVGESSNDRGQGSATRRSMIFLGGVIVLFVALGSFIAIKTPAYEAADEPGHVENVETLVAGHLYGMNSKCTFTPGLPIYLSCSGDEAQQAPLYYLLLAGWQRLIALPARAPYKGQGVPETFLSHGPRYQQGFFLHHSPADHRFLLWLRLPNVLLGALTILFTFLAVRIVTRDSWTPLVAASIVAFLPRFVFLSSFVTNDNLVNLLGAVLTFTSLRYVRVPNGRRMTAVGVVVGLLVITKLSAFPLVVVPVVLSLMVSGLKRRAQFLGIALVSVFGVSGWYLIQNTIRYGDPLARGASARYLDQIGGLGTFPGVPYEVSDPVAFVFVRVPERIFDSFWYQSGWNRFSWPWSVNLLFTLALGIALVGLVHHHVEGKLLIALLTIAVVGFLSVWVVAFQTATYQARYAFVGLVAISALAALGLERWRLWARFLLPTMGLCGTIVAIQQNVLAIHWA